MQGHGGDLVNGRGQNRHTPGNTGIRTPTPPLQQLINLQTVVAFFNHFLLDLIFSIMLLDSGI